VIDSVDTSVVPGTNSKLLEKFNQSNMKRFEVRKIKPGKYVSILFRYLLIFSWTGHFELRHFGYSLDLGHLEPGCHVFIKDAIRLGACALRDPVTFWLRRDCFNLSGHTVLSRLLQKQL
jgi:hypothetical protein